MKEKVVICTRMGQYTRADGDKTNKRVRERSVGTMGVVSKESIYKGRRRERECSCGVMGANIGEISWITI